MVWSFWNATWVPGTSEPIRRRSDQVGVRVAEVERSHEVFVVAVGERVAQFRAGVHIAQAAVVTSDAHVAHVVGEPRADVRVLEHVADDPDPGRSRSWAHFQALPELDRVVLS